MIETKLQTLNNPCIRYVSRIRARPEFFQNNFSLVDGDSADNHHEVTIEHATRFGGRKCASNTSAAVGKVQKIAETTITASQAMSIVHRGNGVETWVWLILQFA